MLVDELDNLRCMSKDRPTRELIELVRKRMGDGEDRRNDAEKKTAPEEPPRVFLSYTS